MFYERFAEKRRLKLVEWFSGHCRAETYHNAVCRSYTSRPSDPVANISLWSSGMRRKQNLEFLGLKVTQQSWLTFRFLSSSLFSIFLPHFVSFAGHLVGFILVGKVFRKAFRILGLGERKG